MKATFDKSKFNADLRRGIAAFDKNHITKASNSDGLPTKAKAPAIISKPAPTVITGGNPIMAGADRSRTPAVAPTSTQVNDFVAIESLAGIASLRPGEVEHLAAHGISAGIRNGVLSISRKYEPAATGILLAARGS